MALTILIAARSLPVHVSGGLESAAWDLARNFAAAGHATTVMTTPHPTLNDRDVLDGVEIRCVPGPSGRYSNAWWKGSADLFRAEYADRADAVLGVSAAANALPAHRSRVRPQVFVFQAHGTSSGEIVSKFRQKTPKAYLSSLRNVYWLLLKDRIYREFDCVVAIGQAVASQLGKWPTKGLLGPTPSTMISNGVDTELFRFDDRVRERVRRDLGIASEAKVILSLCRLHQQKGLAVGLEAVRQALAEDPNLVYLIAGDGPQREELKGLISTLNLGAAVRLLGAIPREAVPGHLSAADALLFPTLRVEGLPITLLEALASGLPVITTPNGGDAALPCRRVAPMDAAATAREILDLIKSPRPQSSLLPEAFSLDHSGAEYIQLFERLLEARRRVRPSGTVAQEESPMTPHGLGGETRVPR